jgi:hypothetical protein
MIQIAASMCEKHPGVCFGILGLQGFHASPSAEFTALKNDVIADIRQKYAHYDRKEFILTDPVCRYVRYYKGYKKTYHVLLQLESILLKGKTLPDAEPLVQALFLAELKHGLLIAGHDLDAIEPPLTIFAAQGGEPFTSMAGQSLELPGEDICMRDGKSAILSIIYGQDQRTRLTANTTRAMYLIDGVEGVTRDQMLAGLQDLLIFTRAFDPAVQVTFMDVL